MGKRKAEYLKFEELITDHADAIRKYRMIDRLSGASICEVLERDTGKGCSRSVIHRA